MTTDHRGSSQTYLLRLPKHAVYNIVGLLLPLPVGLLTIPGLIERFGESRFGLLALAWMLIGYFSLFDFGIARGLTKAITDLNRDDSDKVASVAWTGLILIFCMGLIGGLLVGVIGLTVPLTSFQSGNIGLLDYQVTVALIAFAIPFVLLTAGLRAVLEAYHMFDIVNYLRVPIGIYSFIAPWIVSFFSSLLTASVAAIVFGRIIFLVAHWVVLKKTQGASLRRVPFERAVSGRLLRFGGWLTVTNIISPLLIYIDRFFVATMMSVAAVTYYVTPYEIAARVLVVPAALAGVLFPAMSRSISENRDAIQRVYSGSVGSAYLFLVTIAIFGVILSDLFFYHWLGPVFVERSSNVFKILLVGVLLNGVARIPFTLVQAAGRPDWSAKLHMIELPIFVLVLTVLMTKYGIIGAAVAWFLRVAVDLLGMFYLSGKLAPETRRTSMETGILLMLATACAYIMSRYSVNAWVLACGAGVVVLNAIIVWRRYLGRAERAWVREGIRTFFSKTGFQKNGVG